MPQASSEAGPDSGRGSFGLRRPKIRGASFEVPVNPVGVTSEGVMSGGVRYNNSRCLVLNKVVSSVFAAPERPAESRCWTTGALCNSQTTSAMSGRLRGSRSKQRWTRSHNLLVKTGLLGRSGRSPNRTFATTEADGLSANGVAPLMTLY